MSNVNAQNERMLSDMNSFIGQAESKRASQARTGKAAGGGSWLVELATIMGKMADRMGRDLVTLAKKIDDQMAEKSKAETATGPAGESKPQAFDGQLTELNAYLSANTQLMNMFVQTMNTIIKDIGNSNTDLARK